VLKLFYSSQIVEENYRGDKAPLPEYTELRMKTEQHKSHRNKATEQRSRANRI